jgi:hypothetical protein
MRRAGGMPALYGLGRAAGTSPRVFGERRREGRR